MKTLFIVPYSKDLGKSFTGGDQRTEHLYKALSQFSHCDLISFSDDDSQIDSPLEDFNHIGHLNNVKTKIDHSDIVFLPKKINSLIYRSKEIFRFYRANKKCITELRKFLARENYDCIIYRYLRPSINFRLLNNSKYKIYVDLDDDPLEVIENKIATAPNNNEKRIQKLEYFFTNYIVKKHLSLIDFLFVAKAKDLNRYKAKIPQSVVLPNIPNWRNIEVFDLNEGSKDILFIGSLSYEPNRQGLMDFVKNHWPEISKQVPEAQLRIVGKGLDEDDQQILAQQTNIHYIGFVENLADEYKRARFTISPINEGAGSKIKVLESLAYGRTCVLSAHSYQGVKENLKDDSELLSENPQFTYSQQCIRLLNDTNLLKSLSKNGNRRINEFYSSEVFNKIVESCFGDHIKKG